MNEELMKLNSITAYLSWKLSTEPNNESPIRLTKLGEIQISWRKNWCFRLYNIFRKIYAIDYETSSYYNEIDFSKEFRKELRQFYLLCRGPSYNSEENR